MFIPFDRPEFHNGDAIKAEGDINGRPSNPQEADLVRALDQSL